MRYRGTIDQRGNDLTPSPTTTCSSCPTRTEGLPVALLEAMGSGVVPVVSNIAQRRARSRRWRSRPDSCQRSATSTASRTRSRGLSSDRRVARTVQRRRPSARDGAIRHSRSRGRTIRRCTRGTPSCTVRCLPMPRFSTAAGSISRGFPTRSSAGAHGAAWKVAKVTAPPLVSVLMTAYNRASFIGASIESVLAQTFADFELLIVDDRSTDDTRRHRARVRTARLPRPRGRQRAQPRAVRESQSAPRRSRAARCSSITTRTI